MSTTEGSNEVAPRNTELTTWQADALKLYRKLTEQQQGVTPTVRYFAEQLGVCRTSAHALIKQLQTKGHLALPPITQRRMRITSKGLAATEPKRRKTA